MKALQLLSASVFLLFITALAPADSILTTVNHLVEDEAWGVAHIDVEKLDAEILLRTIFTFSGDPDDAEEVTAATLESINALKGNGVQSLLIVMSMSDMQHGPYLLATSDDGLRGQVGENLQKFATSLTQGEIKTQDFEVIGEVAAFEDQVFKLR